MWFKNNRGKQVGRGVIKLETYEKDGVFSTSCTPKFKGLNKEGLILELQKLIERIRENKI